MSDKKIDDFDNSINTFSSESPVDTERLGALLAKKLANGDSVLLYGDLGAGKTAFVRGIASVIAPRAHVCSPTYAVVNEYRMENGASLRHWDMYRVESDDDLCSIGYYDRAKNGIDCIEWCENIPYALPEHAWRVTITKSNENETVRDIVIEKI